MRIHRELIQRHWPIAAGLLIAAAFLALNHGAYDGFFQDDELDNISWAPHVEPVKYLTELVSPLFSPGNFRPVGHAYFGLMGATFGMNFPPYMTPVFVIHLVNGLLVFSMARKLKVPVGYALGATTFFVLSASAFDAYWKPMYVFDLLCTTFCLLSLLFYAHGSLVLSFIAFWLAYRSKELAVMLPAVLCLYEYWFGRRRFLKLVPFLLVSVSFGLQGILRNPNHGNEYSFRFTLGALAKTIPFYTRRLFFFPFSALLLAPLLFLRDRRVWFALAAAILFAVPLLFLPGRLYSAYVYLPLACSTLAVAAAATYARPQWALILLLLWMPWNMKYQRRQAREKLALDDTAYPFVDTLLWWSSQNPDLRTFVYAGSPSGYHHWGVTAAWNLAHHTIGLKALYIEWPEALRAMQSQAVAYGTWNAATRTLRIEKR